ncbi:DUF4249 family protein [Pedobacter sp. HMF7647]|uniref:DUF4249 family protein n=1 Tax=Hufsiella arboris TaxID=2695275 RepID=A0A7K1Y8A8_9SPHI|nr:DUF4249 domain-containing protein [Hufsiella arboris]MXV50807.1 DUF4249 family protein [Hufsiella arboris]
MTNVIRLLAFCLAVLVFSSCEKVIDVDVDQSGSQLVIEGNLSNIMATQKVKISRSVMFTDSNNFPAVSGAKVTVTDNQKNIITFRENSPGIYSVTYRGVPGRTYTLNVDIEGQTYTAISVMPSPVKLDTLSLTDISFGSRKYDGVIAQYHDPAKTADQYRFLLSINGKQNKQIFVANDRLTNGNKMLTELYPGFSDNDEDEQEFKPRDSIVVEMQCIDPNVFTYWYTLQSQEARGPGGGVTPSNPPSNISNGALGYFSAHTASARKLIVQ